ncbi:hypothetical protein A9261_15090 [Vibrio tasmaniensis]|nr:hypothetical protein A9261_15090 [Vibrio tasmaniensis]
MKKTVLLFSILTTPVLATTDLPVPFLGVKGGYQWAEDGTYNAKNPAGAIFGIYGGVQFSPAWGWDLGYQYHEKLEAKTTSVDIKTTLIESALRYDWNLKNNFSLYGRLGIAYWDLDKKSLSSNKLNASGISPLGELGINYRMTDHIKLTAGYQYIDSLGGSKTGKYDSHGVLLGLSYTFGNSKQPTLINSSNLLDEEMILNEYEQPNEEATVKPTEKPMFIQKQVSDLFYFNSTELTVEFEELLASVASVVLTQPQAKIAVIGHTDSIGTEVYNQRLSEGRAFSVAEKLIEFGVEPERIEVEGMGELSPDSSNETAIGRADNRRAEIIISDLKHYK